MGEITALFQEHFFLVIFCLWMSATLVFLLFRVQALQHWQQNLTEESTEDLF